MQMLEKHHPVKRALHTVGEWPNSPAVRTGESDKAYDTASCKENDLGKPGSECRLQTDERCTYKGPETVCRYL